MISKLFLALVAGTLAVPAVAATVTFAPLTDVDQGPAGDGTTYFENGLTFTSSFAASDGLVHWGTIDSANADPSGATLLQNYPGQSIIVTKTGGGAFLLKSIDLADAYNGGGAGLIQFFWTDGMGLHGANLALDSLVGLQTFTFNYAGVTSFTLVQALPFFQLDNVVVDLATVPEPATWALLIGGFGLTGIAMRRRKAVVA